MIMLSPFPDSSFCATLNHKPVIKSHDRFNNISMITLTMCVVLLVLVRDSVRHYISYLSNVHTTAF